MKQSFQKNERVRNKFAMELFNDDFPYKQKVERDRKNQYSRHEKHEHRWLKNVMEEF